jgi:dTDP-4-amino-4,6-dideoxyglucose formyltransferase
MTRIKSQFNRSVLIVSDNLAIITFLQGIVKKLSLPNKIDIACSPKFACVVLGQKDVRTIDVKKSASEIASDYDLVISAHCKQIFPASLHENVECINIHPGFNPETRGWFPQVWAIFKKIKTGVTVHRIDSDLDHGDIIARFEVPVFPWDTSSTAYNRVINAELNWLENNFICLVEGRFTSFPMEEGGNIFLKKDFDQLCKIDLKAKATYEEVIDRLRALSFDGYKNAYFIEEATGKKIFLELLINLEDANAESADSRRF